MVETFVAFNSAQNGSPDRVPNTSGTPPPARFSTRCAKLFGGMDDFSVFQNLDSGPWLICSSFLSYLLLKQGCFSVFSVKELTELYTLSVPVYTGHPTASFIVKQKSRLTLGCIGFLLGLQGEVINADVEPITV